MTAPNARTGTPELEHVDLPPEAAVPLVSTLIERLVHEHGLRTLTIKGPAAALQGLRPRRDSMDVDVLPHPEDLELSLIHI